MTGCADDPLLLGCKARRSSHMQHAMQYQEGIVQAFQHYFGAVLHLKMYENQQQMVMTRANVARGNEIILIQHDYDS